MSDYKRCPPPVCVVPPVRTAIFGSGRLFQPAPLAMQAPGYAYLGADQNPANPFTQSLPCGPAQAGPLPPATSQTSVVGAGILSPVRWRNNGVFADNYAMPGDIAREPDEGWWPSETIDAGTGQRTWITGMSGVAVAGGRAQLPWTPTDNQSLATRRTLWRTSWQGGGPRANVGIPGLGAFALPSWFNSTFITVAGVRIPNWLGWGAIAFVAYRVAKKRGFIKNSGKRGQQRRAPLYEGARVESTSFREGTPREQGTVLFRVPGGARVRWDDGKVDTVDAGGIRVISPDRARNGRRRNPRRRNGFDSDESLARELELFIDNDGDLYRQQGQPILKNLATKVARGQYDHDKAVKLYMYYMESGAKKYAREHGSGEAGWHTMFPVPIRKMVAERFAKGFETENGLGNYKHLLPKKYQKNRGRSRRRSRRA